MSDLRYTRYTLHDEAKAREIADRLNADPEDTWSYRVEVLSRFAVVVVEDEHGMFVGNL